MPANNIISKVLTVHSYKQLSLYFVKYS